MQPPDILSGTHMQSDNSSELLPCRDSGAPAAWFSAAFADVAWYLGSQSSISPYMPYRVGFGQSNSKGSETPNLYLSLYPMVSAFTSGAVKLILTLVHRINDWQNYKT